MLAQSVTVKAKVTEGEPLRHKIKIRQLNWCPGASREPLAIEYLSVRVDLFASIRRRSWERVKAGPLQLWEPEPVTASFP